MIASCRCDVPRSWQHQFLELAPGIRRFARISFRYLDPANQEEAVAEAIAAAMVAFRRLVQMARAHLAYVTPLARYAVLHVKSGRYVGGRQNHRDVLSKTVQWQHGFQVKSLHDLPYESSRWVEEAVPEDRRSTPADLAAMRMDFKSWLGTLTASQHRIARALASGETTKTAAEMLGLTPGRISQVRSVLEESWCCFQAQAIGR